MNITPPGSVEEGEPKLGWPGPSVQSGITSRPPRMRVRPSRMDGPGWCFYGESAPGRVTVTAAFVTRGWRGELTREADMRAPPSAKARIFVKR